MQKNNKLIALALVLILTFMILPADRINAETSVSSKLEHNDLNFGTMQTIKDQPVTTPIKFEITGDALNLNNYPNATGFELKAPMELVNAKGTIAGEYIAASQKYLITISNLQIDANANKVGIKSVVLIPSVPDSVDSVDQSAVLDLSISFDVEQLDVSINDIFVEEGSSLSPAAVKEAITIKNGEQQAQGVQVNFSEDFVKNIEESSPVPVQLKFIWPASESNLGNATVTKQETALSKDFNVSVWILANIKIQDDEAAPIEKNVGRIIIKAGNGNKFDWPFLDRIGKANAETIIFDIRSGLDVETALQEYTSNTSFKLNSIRCIKPAKGNETYLFKGFSNADSQPDVIKSYKVENQQTKVYIAVYATQNSTNSSSSNLSSVSTSNSGGGQSYVAANSFDYDRSVIRPKKVLSPLQKDSVPNTGAAQEY